MSVESVTCARRAGCFFRDECAGRECRLVGIDITINPPPDITVHTTTNTKEPPMIAGETILAEAQRLTTEDRNHTYGPFTVESQKIAKVWSAILGFDVPPEKVALCMIGLKCVRASHSYHRDSYVDIAGFASIGHDCAKAAS